MPLKGKIMEMFDSAGYTVLGEGKSSLDGNWSHSPEKVKISGNCKEICEGAFEDNQTMKSLIIGHGVEKIGARAFCDCFTLREICLPKSLKECDMASFGGITAANTVRYAGTIEEFIDLCQGSPYASILQNKALNTSRLYVNGSELVTSIKTPEKYKVVNSWLSYCESLESVEICEGVEEIDMYAFARCISLRDVRLPSTLRKIGKGAFQICEAISELVIPEGVEEICEDAFFGCMLLEKLILPKSLKKIEKGAFESCGSLEYVYVPSKNTEIAEGAFEDTTALAFEGEEDETTKGESYTAEELLEELCYEHEGAVVTGHLDPRSVLKIPYGTTEIEGCAFEGCGILRYVYIPSTVKRIGESAFSDCESLKAVIIDTGEGCVIEENAFMSCPSLYRVVLPEGLEEISDYCFQYTGIEYIDIPQSVERIGKHAFDECYELKEIKLPRGILEIGESAFCDCDSLTLAHIGGKNGAVIGESAFEGCEVLKDLTFSEGIEKIGAHAFLGCEKIDLPVLPSALKEIGAGAFARCAFSSVKIPSTVEIMGEGVFEGCFDCSSIDIIGRESVPSLWHKDWDLCLATKGFLGKKNKKKHNVRFVKE